MPEMKAMEFTDKLNLQPVTRPVPEPKAGEILIQVYATGGTPTEKLWVYHQSLCGWLDTIQGDPRARILRHRCRVSNPS
jgi:NADPH:quinone reductase-like Zn-dependent oxidoreductase